MRSWHRFANKLSNKNVDATSWCSTLAAMQKNPGFCLVSLFSADSVSVCGAAAAAGVQPRRSSLHQSLFTPDMDNGEEKVVQPLVFYSFPSYELLPLMSRITH